MSGYSLIKGIERNTGCWKPSPGSIYPLLFALKDAGLVDLQVKGRSKVYSLTKSGERYFADMEKKKDDIISSLNAKLRMFKTMPKDDSSALLLEVVRNVHKQGFPLKIFKGIGPSLHALRSEMIRLHLQGKISSKKDRIEAILKDALSKLKRV